MLPLFSFFKIACWKKTTRGEGAIVWPGKLGCLLPRGTRSSEGSGWTKKWQLSIGKGKKRKKQKTDSSSKARTKHVKRSGQNWSAQIPVPPSSSTMPQAVAILLPLENLPATHSHSRRAVHALRALLRSPPTHPLKADHVWGRVRSGARETQLSWLAPAPEENKRSQGGARTVPCKRITSVQASGLHTPGRRGPEVLIRPGRKTKRADCSWAD